MTPKTYVDYCLKCPPKASMPEVAKAASCLMKCLHAAFSDIPGHAFALALIHSESPSPQKKLSVFRIFAESMEAQQSLHDFVLKSCHYNDLFFATFPQSVPADFSGRYVAYARLRVASRAKPEMRLKKMIKVTEEGNLWIDMVSKENGNRFRMYIRRIEGSSSSIGRLNSYGLSDANQLVFLPELQAD